MYMYSPITMTIMLNILAMLITALLMFFACRYEGKEVYNYEDRYKWVIFLSCILYPAGLISSIWCITETLLKDVEWTKPIGKK